MKVNVICLLICMLFAVIPVFSYDLVVDLSNRYRPVTHLASGSLYGLRDEGRPPDSLISPTRPFMFVQPAANGEHAPYSYPSGTGDILDTARIAARNGATVTMRMADTFPTFPYNFTSMTDWENRVNQMITDWLNSGNNNLYGYEIFNEPDYTYNGSPSFYDVWRTTYNIIRQRHPGAKIIGPSTTGFNSFCIDFLNWARSNNCLPDIVCWHELSNAYNVQRSIDSYKSLGIGKPISINEYVASGEDGQPGKITDYIATFERNLEVESACLPFWSTCGSLGNILTSSFQPNGAWHVMKWYGDMNGSMVWTQDPASMIDGFSSINSSRNQAYIIFGGADNQRIVVNGFSSTTLGSRVHVYAEYTEWVGINTTYSSPGFWFEDNYDVSHNQIIINVNNLNEFSAHRITITPAGGSASTTTTSASGTTTTSISSSSSGNGTPFRMRARGTAGSEQVRIKIGETEAANFTLGTSMGDYSFSSSLSGELYAQFYNDGSGRDVLIDYISVNGDYRQAEDMSYNTGVWQDGSCGGSYSEWLHCNGTIGFGSVNDGSTVVSTTTTTSVSISGSTSITGVKQIRNRSTGLFLDGMGRTTNGADAGQYADTTHANAHWNIVSAGSGYYYLINQGTNMKLDGYGRTTNGAACAQYSSSTTHVNAQWSFVSAGSGYYYLVNRGTGMKLDGYGRTENGSTCAQYSSSTTNPNAQWQIVD